MKKFILLLIALAFQTEKNFSQVVVIDSIMHDNTWRSYRLYLPSGYNSSLSLPLVFNLHGLGSNGSEQEAYTQFNAVAETGNAIVCHPNGLNNSWNVTNSGADDIGFIDTLITIFNNQYNINLNRVYSTGLSNGGFMSNLLACQLSHRIAAIAPVAGTSTVLTAATCNPSRYVPVLYIHGTSDAIVQYNGGTGYVSAADLMSLWSGINNCSSVTDTVLLPDISTTDLCRAELITWQNCDSSKHVVHYRIIDGGHTWPDAIINIGVTNRDFNASQVIWDFFNQFSLTTNIDEHNPFVGSSVFPNPFSSDLSIRLEREMHASISIFSSDGRKLFSRFTDTRNISLEMNNYTNGMYFIQISSGANSQVLRCVKVGS